ncbi:hypothetical protein QRO11_18110 [Paracidovorax citrulli]|uniref:Uncharacterized protein n=2 Tax=Paracidovorax citrulli TaxID=80869 RepID=A1TL99_PARC0|nr:hypothetical protein [Paracidovorax citrulli]ABM31737.1 hypothetical protein Aave_1145 [Paracidovorax citrulli AAC00-1]ATG95191.1 hypothetical protein CQB05_15125 [Paracidovorax citrulli]MVT38268.1 hypothetical protein [Paracidovorax citrulli]PVY65923.1 hypothetical protein C8E08_3311 [Paracidovorax citrulli]QCX11653.1 hypothetical protein APS58_2856 [Paracidovorax citrulli]
MLASFPLPSARAGAPADHRAEGPHPCGPRYWPAQTLDAFLLQMAARGHCISAAMMLGDRAYALEQIALARRLPGETLQGLVKELAAYFEDAEPAVAGLHWSHR